MDNSIQGISITLLFLFAVIFTIYYSSKYKTHFCIFFSVLILFLVVIIDEMCWIIMPYIRIFFADSIYILRMFDILKVVQLIENFALDLFVLSALIYIRKIKKHETEVG